MVVAALQNIGNIGILLPMWSWKFGVLVKNLKFDSSGAEVTIVYRLRLNIVYQEACVELNILM